MKINLTAIILTCNEEKNIQGCLKNLNWVSRIVIVDSGSTDHTTKYAEEFGCDVYRNPWKGFANQRNWALQEVGINTEWIIFIDADEVVTSQMREEITAALKSRDCNAFYLCYKVIFLGKWVKYSSGFPVWHPRIVRNGFVHFRESITGHGETWEVNGRAGYIQEPYIHYCFSKGITSWFEKHNRLSTMEMEVSISDRKPFLKCIMGLLNQDSHKRRQSLRALSYYMPFRPFVRFFYQFILKGGILDGKAGWAYCCLYLAYEIMISVKILERKYSG
ncbi:MAG: glycosyltransferase family 2 protein [Desulfobacteraceae bacterium]|nr:MAG: glycosyltransferase family 2 protein [Desulfobacteraceae bacterium]